MESIRRANRLYLGDNIQIRKNVRIPLSDLSLMTDSDTVEPRSSARSSVERAWRSLDIERSPSITSSISEVGANSSSPSSQRYLEKLDKITRDACVRMGEMSSGVLRIRTSPALV